MKVGLDATTGSARGLTALLAGFLILGLATGGCASSQRSKTTALPKELRVGVAPIFPPLAMKREGKIVGIEADFVRLIGEQLAVKTTLVELPWEELVPSLIAGKIDVIMSGMSITAARAQVVDFTVPYMAIGQMALVRRNELARLRDQAALDQSTSRVGVVQNTTADFYCRRTLKQAKVVPFTSISEGVAALRGKQIDFLIADAPTIWDLTSRDATQNADLAGVYRRLTTEYLAWAVRHDDQPLRRQLNQTILLWQENGQLEDILDDWISTRRVMLQMK